MILKYFVYMCLYMVLSIRAYRTIKYGGAELILAKAGETIDIVCENDLPLARCGFSHPNGTKILFANVVPGTPSCKFTTDATSSEVGLWTCHFWTPTSPQKEIIKTVELRVPHKFASLDKEVEVREGDKATLSCVTSEQMVPLNDCYFISPEQHKIHMNEKTTKENIVLNKYFFPRNMSVHRGDCSITIVSAAISDAGAWSCYGWLELENREYTDTVHLTVLSDAIETIRDDDPIVISVTTYICGSLVFLCIFTVLVYCKYKHFTLYYGKTWGDDESINNYMMKQRADPTPLVLADHLLVT